MVSLHESLINTSLFLAQISTLSFLLKMDTFMALYPTEFSPQMPPFSGSTPESLDVSQPGAVELATLGGMEGVPVSGQHQAL